MLRRFSSLVALCLGAYLACAQGGPDDQFIVAYNLIQQAEQSRDARVASHLFEQAHSQLLKIQRSYPSWNERVISYRLRFCSEKLATLREALPWLLLGATLGALAVVAAALALRA